MTDNNTFVQRLLVEVVIAAVTAAVSIVVTFLITKHVLLSTNENALLSCTEARAGCEASLDACDTRKGELAEEVVAAETENKALLIENTRLKARAENQDRRGKEIEIMRDLGQFEPKRTS